MDYIEILGLIAATLTTAAFVPQVYKTWQQKSTKDISLTMYLVMFDRGRALVYLWNPDRQFSGNFGQCPYRPAAFHHADFQVKI